MNEEPEGGQRGEGRNDRLWRRISVGMVAGIAVGVAIRTAVGLVVLDNPAFGSGVGLAIGAAVGAVAGIALPDRGERGGERDRIDD